MGDHGAGGAMAVAAPKLCSGGLFWWQKVFPRGGQVLVIPRCGVGERPRAKSIRSDASGDDASGCRFGPSPRARAPGENS